MKRIFSGLAICVLLALTLVTAVCAESKLIITLVDAKVGSRTDKSIGNTSTISREAKPEDKVTFTIKLENRYSSAEDLYIEDIDVEVTIKDIDDGDDLEESTTISKITDGQDKKTDLSFRIPLFVDEGTYDVLITAEGDDENGTKQETSWTIELEVKKEKHNLSIQNERISPNEISCSRSIALAFRLINLGQEDEDETVVRITSPGLGINDRLDLDISSGYHEDSAYDFEKNYAIADDVDEGTYNIDVKAYYDSSKLIDSHTYTIEVKGCSTKAAEQSKDGNNSSDNARNGGQQQTQQTNLPVLPQATASSQKSGSWTYILIGEIFLVLLVALITLAVIKKKR